MNKNTVKYTFLALLTLAVCALLFIKTQVCADGIKQGIILCADTVVPSLLPFMIVSQFILKSGLADFLGERLEKITGFLFKQPGITSGVILMSFIGGFPIGAKMTADLLKEHKITKNQAQRLNLFCINAGPAFTVGTVGSAFAGSKKAGVILYCSVCLAALFTGVLTRFLDDGEKESDTERQAYFMTEPVEAFSRSASDAAKSMLSVCAWIIIFNSIISCIKSIGDYSYVTALCCFLEVTSGIKLALGVLPFPAVAAILSFAGLSVHCQIYSFVSESRLKIRYFYAARIICAAVSSLICAALLKLFPCDIQTFQTSSETVMSVYSISLPAAMALIGMCAVLIFEVDTDRKKC